MISPNNLTDREVIVMAESLYLAHDGDDYTIDVMHSLSLRMADALNTIDEAAKITSKLLVSIQT